MSGVKERGVYETHSLVIDSNYRLFPVQLYGKNNRIDCLTLGAGGDILLGQDDQKPFQCMYTWQIQRRPFEEIAISAEPGAAGFAFRDSIPRIYGNDGGEFVPTQ